MTTFLLCMLASAVALFLCYKESSTRTWIICGIAVFVVSSIAALMRLNL